MAWVLQWERVTRTSETFRSEAKLRSEPDRVARNLPEPSQQISISGQCTPRQACQPRGPSAPPVWQPRGRHTAESNYPASDTSVISAAVNAPTRKLLPVPFDKPGNPQALGDFAANAHDVHFAETAQREF